MVLADIGRAITGQALDTAKSSMLDAIRGESDKKPVPSAAPASASASASAYDSLGSVILAQLQGMQKSLKEDQELVVQFRSGEEMLRIVEIFVPSPQVFVLSGNDGQQRLTRIVAPAATVQLICKILRVAPGATPVRLKVIAPTPAVRPPDAPRK